LHTCTIAFVVVVVVSTPLQPNQLTRFCGVSEREEFSGGAVFRVWWRRAMEEEHEVYGGDIPDEVEGDIEGDSDGEPDDLLLKGDDIPTDEVASKVSVDRLFSVAGSSRLVRSSGVI
jgi:hypothetical protein